MGATMSHISKISRLEPLTAEDGRLLWTLHGIFGRDRFDEYNISANLASDPGLKAALAAALGTGRIPLRRGGGSSRMREYSAVERWLRRVAGDKFLRIRVTAVPRGDFYDDPEALAEASWWRAAAYGGVMDRENIERAMRSARRRRP